MRGAPWLACLAILALVLAALPFVAQAGDAGPEPGEASPVGSGRPRIFEGAGTALFHFSGACLDNGTQCYGDQRMEEGSFFLPSVGSDGYVVVSWRPANESLRVLRVKVSGMEQTGESPLRFVVPGLPAGEHRVSVAPASRLLGAYDQTVDWTATFSLDEPAEMVQAHGAASFRVGVACHELLGGCDPVARSGSDELVAPWTARGSLTATWEDPVDLVVCIRGTDRCAEGPSPLTLVIDGLAQGSHRLDVRPPAPALPLASGEVAWAAVLTPA